MKKHLIIALGLLIILGGCSTKTDEEKATDLKNKYTLIWDETVKLQKSKKTKGASKEVSKKLINMYNENLNILKELKEDYSQTDLMKNASIAYLLLSVNTALQYENKELEKINSKKDIVKAKPLSGREIMRRRVANMPNPFDM